LIRAKSDLKDSQQLFDQGYLTRTDLETDKFKATEAEIELEKANKALWVLETYTFKMALTEKSSDVTEAEKELDRADKSALASKAKAEADKAAAKKGFAAVPLFQRYHPFVSNALRMLSDGAFGPLSHFHFRSNRASSARYVSWGSPWMLDPAVASGGCLRNIGLHGIDLFLHLAGENPSVMGAQTSSRALGKDVEDYAAVLLRTPEGVLGSIEVGNVFPAQGADGEWKLSGRDALLVQQGGSVRCTTAAGEREIAEPPAESLALVALRDILARWKSGQPPATGPADCCRAMRVVDAAYTIARQEIRHP